MTLTAGVIASRTSTPTPDIRRRPQPGPRTSPYPILRPSGAMLRTYTLTLDLAPADLPLPGAIESEHDNRLFEEVARYIAEESGLPLYELRYSHDPGAAVVALGSDERLDALIGVYISPDDWPIPEMGPDELPCYGVVRRPLPWSNPGGLARLEPPPVGQRHSVEIRPEVYTTGRVLSAEPRHRRGLLHHWDVEYALDHPVRDEAGDWIWPRDAA